jgi:hypothetical protein
VGNFEARFEPLPAENGFPRERKTKLAYRAAAAAVPEVLASSHILRWSRSLHLPETIRGEESTRLGAAANSLVALSQYELLFRSQAHAPEISSAYLRGLDQNASLALDTATPDFSSHPDYAKLDWNTILHQLRGLGDLPGGQQLAVFGDALRYLRLHPEKLSDLAEMLRDPGLLKLGSSSPLFKTIVGALATIASPEALLALREAYEDKNLAAPSKATILAALATTQAPIDAPTREFLAEKMRSEQDPHLSQGAAFALGFALQNAANDSQAANAIRQIESAWHALPPTLGDQLALLDVMGNSGRAEFLPDLKSTIAGSPDPSLRARAVLALRFIKNGAATQELAARLADKETVVREAAAGAIALADWSETFRSPLERCSQLEAVGRIQESCRNTLGQNPLVADSQ